MQTKLMYDGINNTINTMTNAEKREFAGLFTPTMSSFLPKGLQLSNKQTFFMIMRQQDRYAPVREFIMYSGEKHGLDVSFMRDRPFIPFEALYGGSGNSGKSYMLSILALTTADTYGLDVRVFTEEKQAKDFTGGVGEQLEEWITPLINNRTIERDKEKAIFQFPSGGKIHFGGLYNESAWEKYKGGNIAQMIFDEVTNIHPVSYTKQTSAWCRKSPRARKIGYEANVCAATNPHGKYVDFYKKRFVERNDYDTFYLQALPQDNPFIDYEAYKRNLLNSGDMVFAKQMLEGRWDIVTSGDLFTEDSLIDVPEVPEKGITGRGWDIAATKGKKSKYTAGLKMRYYDGIYYIMDIDNFKETPSKNDELMRIDAQADTRECRVYTELQPGAAGKYLEEHFNKNVFNGFNHKAISVPADKQTRALAFSIACENKLVRIWSGCRNKEEFKRQLVGFPNGEFVDMVDACTLVFNEIQKQVATYSGGVPQTSSSNRTETRSTKQLVDRSTKRSKWDFYS